MVKLVETHHTLEELGLAGNLPREIVVRSADSQAVLSYLRRMMNPLQEFIAEDTCFVRFPGDPADTFNYLLLHLAASRNYAGYFPANMPWWELV